MHPIRTPISQSFAPAAIGARIRLFSILAAVAVLFAIAGVAIFAPREHGNQKLIPVVGVATVMPVLLLCWWGARIRDYRIADDLLHVVRPFYTARIPLAGLVSVVADRDAMAGAWKTVGNDGLGAIAGRFRSRKLGRFRAYVTDPEYGVVLRWPAQCLVVSPEKPGLMVEALSAYCSSKTPE